MMRRIPPSKYENKLVSALKYKYVDTIILYFMTGTFQFWHPIRKRFTNRVCSCYFFVAIAVLLLQKMPRLNQKLVKN